MRRVVYGENARLLAWAEAQTHGRYFADAQSIGYEVAGQLRAVFVFDIFMGSGCFMHVASDGSPHWATRQFLIHAFAYPFITCGFRRVTADISERNEPAVRLVKHLGAVFEGRLREAGRDGEAVLMFGLLRRDCRWLPENGVPLFPAVGPMRPLAGQEAALAATST